MNAVAVVGHTEGVKITEDPHGLKARMLRLGVTNRDLARRLGIAENTVGRAINTTTPSNNRERIVDELDRLESERGGVALPARVPETVRKLARLVGDDRLLDARIEFIQGGRGQQIVALTVDNDLSEAEVEALIREWREGRGADE